MAESKKTTAGLRGADWDPAKQPDGMCLEALIVQTEDGASLRGVLYSLGDETTVVTLQHPREAITTHYMVPELLAGGVAVYLQFPRMVGNDIRLEHERALFDVAASVRMLRERGYDKVLLLGNSGGAGLFTFYLQQANAAPADRITLSPGGRPTGLMEANLPTADGLILLSPHMGQGVLCLMGLDPSVIDESDPLSIASKLSPFMPQNGYKRPPTSASYSVDFQADYRTAQIARCERIDAAAREQIERRLASRKKIKAGDGSPMDQIISAHTPIFNVWRTDADLRSWDLSIDPSDRPYGSLWGTNPFASNWGSVGFGRVCTAESWLSTWSGLSSNASMAKCAPGVNQPVMLVRYAGDQTVFPQDARNMLNSFASADKEPHVFPGDHHGRAVGSDGEAGREMAGQAIRDWIKERF